jgi:hypothetical protein
MALHEALEAPKPPAAVGFCARVGIIRAMKLITTRTPLADLKRMAEETFGDLLKAVVDVERGIMVVGGELHSDEEALLLGMGSKQEGVWGINIFPNLPADDRIEIDSVINLRPSKGNRTRGVDDAETRQKILRIVNGLIQE